MQEAIVRGQRIVREAVPGAQLRTFALPLGALPDDPALARRGSWDGESYRHDGVFLVGAEPSHSPFSKTWKPLAIPRIRTGVWDGGEPDFAAGFWLSILEDQPGRRFVSDGDPSKISFPRSVAERLRPRLQARANPYSGRLRRYAARRAAPRRAPG